MQKGYKNKVFNKGSIQGMNTLSLMFLCFILCLCLDWFCKFDFSKVLHVRRGLELRTCTNDWVWSSWDDLTIGRMFKSKYLLTNLPWYNHNGWLDVKHQVTYTQVLWSKWVLCISSFRILVFAMMRIAGRTFSNFGLLPTFRMMLAPRANSPSFTKAPKGTPLWAGCAVC